MIKPLAAALLAALLGCAPADAPPAAPPAALSQEALLDPDTCKDCHPAHHRQWSGSMHAYAAEDPVFLAMDAKGQRDTGGALGDFCVQCHAPVAHRLGLARSAADLAAVPRPLQGVTCVWCHQIDAVHGTRNNPLSWAADGLLRGGIRDPAASPHQAAYSPLLDRDTLDSSALCGSCHDIGLPHNDLHLERTFAEWQGSLYANPDALRFNSCGHCHLRARVDVAAVGGPPRRIHDHAMVGVDVALTPFPEREDQRQRIQRALDNTLVAEICVVERRGGAEVEYALENIGAGHNFPSGAALDRRAWVSLEAFAGGRSVYRSGHIGDGEPVVDAADPDLWLMRDIAFDAAGETTHDFWSIERLEHHTLPVITTLDPLAPGYVPPHVMRRYIVRSDAPLESIETRVNLRPIGLDVLDALIASGDLDPALRARIPTFSFAPLTWTPAAAVERRSLSGRDARCVP